MSAVVRVRETVKVRETVTVSFALLWFPSTVQSG
jgi:hypothetical protein